MAGAMRKMALYLGLVEDEDRYGTYDDDYDERDDSREGRAGHEPRDPREVRDGREGREPQDGRDAREPRTDLRERSSARGPVTAVGEAAVAGRASVATMPVRRPASGATHMSEVNRITTIHPRTYNEAKTIGESFREGTPVIMNLTDMDDSDAKRLVDFAAGLVFGLHGTIERVTNKVFLLSPANVTVTAEDKARMAEGSFFNQS